MYFQETEAEEIFQADSEVNQEFVFRDDPEDTNSRKHSSSDLKTIKTVSATNL